MSYFPAGKSWHIACRHVFDLFIASMPTPVKTGMDACQKDSRVSKRSRVDPLHGIRPPAADGTDRYESNNWYANLLRMDCYIGTCPVPISVPESRDTEPNRTQQYDGNIVRAPSPKKVSFSCTPPTKRHIPSCYKIQVTVQNFRAVIFPAP